MIKVNKKVEYALMALKYMIEKPVEELTSVREICNILKTPFDTMAKVMQNMNANGIVNSLKGVKGGYTIQQDLSKISFMELICMIEGRTSNLNCSKGLCGCECNIKKSMIELNHKIRKSLEKISLKDFLVHGLKS